MTSFSHGFSCNIFWNTRNFKYYTSRFDNGYIIFNISFARAHPYLSRFLSYRFMRKNVNPYFSSTFHSSSYCNSCGFYLSSCYIGSFNCLNSIVTKIYSISTFRVSFSSSSMRFSVFCLFRHQHNLLFF